MKSTEDSMLWMLTGQRILKRNQFSNWFVCGVVRWDSDFRGVLRKGSTA